MRIARTAPFAAILFATAWCLGPGVSNSVAQPMGKTKEFQSLNTDLYKVSIQKDGRLDITYATDVPVITDVFPMIWFDGKPAPERLKTKGQWSERYLVEDKLGQGQGVHQQHKGCVWSLRAYPTRPYFAAQLGYTNESDEPVRIKALLPWCVGDPGKGMILLGPASEQAGILTASTTGAPVVAQGTAQSDDAIALFNGGTRQSFVAGFITQDRAHSYFEIGAPIAEKKDDPSGFGHFRAVSYFDTPVELAPGDTLYSEVLYMSISELEPAIGLQRYARAVQVVNGHAGPEHDDPLHAWVINTDEALSGDELVSRLRHARETVPLTLISNVLIGPTTSPARTIEVDPAIVSLVRNEGFTPILWFDPLAGGPDAIANPSPEAQRQSGEHLRKTYGAISVAGVRLAVNGAAAQPSIEALRSAVMAFRDGLGPNAHVYGADPSLLAASLFDGVITGANDRRYFTPQPSRHAVYFAESDAESDSFRAQIAAATLLDCGLLLPLPPVDNNAMAELLTRLLPSPKIAARAIDLFATQPPRAFHLIGKMPDGDIHVAAVINWTGTSPVSVSLPLARIGFVPGAYYTVYDYWRQAYLGTAADTLDVTIPPGGASVLVFRPVVGHPMLVSTGANLGQDSPALRRVDWNAQTHQFTVELATTAVSETGRRFTISTPAPYRVKDVINANGAPVEWKVAETSVVVTLPEGQTGFTVLFDVTP